MRLSAAMLSAAALIAALGAASPAAAHDRLGANLNLISDFTRNHEFVDVMRQSRAFGSFADPFNTVIPVGADGWPTGDFGVTLMGAQAGVAGLSGTYRILFNGRATVTSAASGTVGTSTYDAVANETRVDFSFPSSGETLALRFSVMSGSSVKNLRVIRPGFDPASHPTFTPTYLAHVSRFRILRFMDWLDTNNSANTIVAWSDRPTADRKHTESEGARWETVIELANTAKRDPWINIPVRANDDYVRNLATLLRDTLDPSLNVYVEYSNELWNGAFQQFAINRDLAIAEAASSSSPLRLDGSTDTSVWAFRRIGKRLKEIGDIFASAWGAGAINNRVRLVLAGQMGNSFIVSEGLDVVDRGLGVRPSTVFYAISGAPYIFPSATNDSNADEAAGLTADQILDGIAAGVANAPRSYQYEAHAGLAAWYGLRMLGYEGGFDTFGGNNIAAKRQANLDPRIRTHCRKLLDDWYAAGFEHFLWYNAGAASFDTPFGAWPLLEDLSDPAKPKNQCMDDTIAGALPAITMGFATGSAIPAGSYQGATSPGGTLTNVSSPFGFPGYAQYLVRAPQAGSYQLRLHAMGASVPIVGIQLNGAVVTPSLAIPETTSFADTQPVAITLREGLNALRLVRPAAAGQWTVESLTVSASGTPAAPNYTAMWWNRAEPGWGINVTHQSDRIFTTLFTYAADGRDMWIVGSDLVRQPDGSYTGPIHRATGPAFNASPWTAFNLSQVGTMTLRFTASNSGTLSYSINGVTVSKSIEPYAYNTPPVCTSAPGSRAAQANYQDMWWNRDEPGWGVNITHQGDIIFTTLFTYAADGRDLWLVGSSLARQPDGRYTGPIHRATGPPFNAAPWGAFALTEVGTMTLAFTDGEHGTLAYTFQGVSVSKRIERYVFDTAVAVCR